MKWSLRQQEFLAKALMTFAHALFAVGLASHLFKEFPSMIRLSCAVGFFILVLLSLYIYPAENPEK